MNLVSVPLTYRNTFFTIFAGSGIIILVSGKYGKPVSGGEFMKHHHLLKRLVSMACTAVLCCTVLLSCAFAYQDTTLYNGCQGEEVRELQQALIDLGYLQGKADGIFGNKTENAVRAFQKKNNLVPDGLAGKKTRDLIMKMAETKRKQKTTPKPTKTPKPTATPKPASTKNSSSSNLFGGNYTTIRYGDRGARVKILQKALKTVKFLTGSVDGIFGNKTRNAVKSFQRSKNLTADGLAGKKTLKALEKAVKGKNSSSTPKPTATPKPTKTPKPTATPKPGSKDDVNEKITPPKVSKLKLLHWFKDVKPSLSNGQKLLIYDPVSGLSWTLRILSRGRHCDSEPLTAKDTRTMVKAFGGVNTWTQKPVYVKLPDGRWTIGATHDMPHMSGSIKDNNFDGHLCVHFLRDMDEAKQNDPSYGVSNQQTIRQFWKKLTGEVIP